MPSPSRRLALIGAGLTAVLVVAATPTQAATAVRTTTEPATAAAGWLAQQFVDASHKPSPTGDHFDASYVDNNKTVYYFDGGLTADAIFGLAAAKVGEAKIDAAIAYFAKHVDDYTSVHDTSGKPGPLDGQLAKTALAAIVAGADPRHFGGYDMVQTLKNDECTSVSVQTPADFTVPNCPAIGAGRNIYSSISESLIIIAESRASTFTPSADAVNYFLSLQCSDGGFISGGVDPSQGCTSGIDETASGAMALAALGDHQAELTRALDWLTSKRKSNGSWTPALGGSAVNSTGLAASALDAAGRDVAASRNWLASQQLTTGVTIGTTATRGALALDGRADVRSTTQGILGLAHDSSLATLTDEGASMDAPVLAPTASVSHASVAQGGKLSVTGIGFSAAERVRATVHSAAVTVATVTAATDGTAKVTFTVPTTLATGQHTVELLGLTSTLSVSTPFTVTAAPASTSAAATPIASPGPTGASSTIQSNPELPATGSPIVPLTLAGSALLALGGVAVVAGRRRRT